MQPGATMTEWQWTSFDRMSADALYAVLAARQNVFVIEQQCIYPDIDGLDADAYHLLGWQRHADGRRLAAYLRCLAPGVRYAEPSLGRVLSIPSVRGNGIGKALVEQGIQHTGLVYAGCRIRISAQQYLQRFYEGFGFQVTSQPYDEDGIAHIEMLR
jgi:ElaA protein